MLYSTKGKGIGGVIKQRVTDFIVEEIDFLGRKCEVKRFLSGRNPEGRTIKVPVKPEGKDQLILLMECFNLDTNTAIRKIARFLQTSRKRVGFAGMKDKRALTGQRISIWQPDIKLVEEFNANNLDLREAEWSDKRIDLGCLKGNHFRIAIRGIELEKEAIEKRLADLFRELDEGIANYFGEQRFGGIRNVSHLVGKEIFKGNLKEAVMLYLTKESDREPDDIKEARKALKESMDFKQALRNYPIPYRFERALINHLNKYPNDFKGALNALPKNLRLMFIHAFQSHLFNKMINERMNAGIGLNAVKDDLPDEEGMPTAPLIGFETEWAKGRIREIEQKVLEEEGMSLKDFKVKEFPEMSSKGARKRIVLKPSGLKLIGIEADDFNEGKSKAVMEFDLRKGDYATTVLREIIKKDEVTEND